MIWDKLYWAAKVVLINYTYAEAREVLRKLNENQSPNFERGHDFYEKQYELHDITGRVVQKRHILPFEVATIQKSSGFSYLMKPGDSFEFVDVKKTTNYTQEAALVYGVYTATLRFGDDYNDEIVTVGYPNEDPGIKLFRSMCDGWLEVNKKV